MKRRANNRSRTQGKRSKEPKFTYARLEPRQLLAGDLAAGRTLAHGLDFGSVKPAEVKPAEVEIVEEVCTFEETKEGAKAKPIADCLPRIGTRMIAVESYTLFAQLDGFSFDTDSPFDYRFLGSGSGSDVNEPGTPDVISTPIEEPIPDRSPVENLPLEEPSEEYFQKTIQTDPVLEQLDKADQTEMLSIESTSPSPRIGMLGSQQMFALIPPSFASPSTFGVLGQSGPLASNSSNAVMQSLQQIDVVFSSLDHHFKERYLKTSVLENQHNDGPIAQKDFSLNFLTDGVREFGTSFESSGDSPFVRESPFDAKSKRESSTSHFDIVDSNEEMEAEVHKASQKPPVKPSEPTEETATDETLSRSVQIVESTLLLIGISGTRVRRDDLSDRDPRPTKII